MSKHEKKEPKKESVAKKEATKPLSAQEQKDSDMAKQIIDLETKLNLKDAELKAKDETIQKLTNEIKDFNASFKDLALDMENKANALLKQRCDEQDIKFKAELDDAKKYAIKDQALELINIINEFERAVSFKPQDPKIANWLVGFKMYLTKFNNLLNDLHISQIQPTIGCEFDPNIMECFPETVIDPSKKDNTVVEVIHSGYKLYDHILKPALVKVVKNS